MRTLKYAPLLLIACLLLLFGVIQDPESVAATGPKIIWDTPLLLSRQALIGTVSFSEISFTSDEEVSSLQVWVVPSLAPFVSERQWMSASHHRMKSCYA